MSRTNWFAGIIAWEITGFLIALLGPLGNPDFHSYLHFLLLGLTITNSAGLLGSVLWLFYDAMLGQRVNRPALNLLFGAFVAILAIGAGLFAGRWVVDQICNLETAHAVESRHILFLIVNLIFVFLIAGAYAMLLLLARAKTSMEKNLRGGEEWQRLELESKLAILQARLNPHFLLDTLNAILNLLYEQPQKVEHLLLNLSGIYRKVLTLSHDQLIPLEEELRLVRECLEIEKIRLDGRLEFDLSAEDKVLGYKIPPFIIANSVESTIRQGIFSQKKGIKVFVGVHQVANAIFIHIRDNGMGSMRKSAEEGFGIFSVKELLKMAYGEKAKFNISSLPGGGTQVSMELPWESPPRLAERMETNEAVSGEKEGI